MDVEAGEKPWDLSYNREVGVVLCVAGKRIEVHLFSYLCRIIVMGLIWLAVWSALPKHLMELHGYIFDPLLVFVVSALVGGFVCRILTIPPLIGIFFVAIALNNVPSAGELTRGIYKDVRTVISTIGLTMILTRAGLSLNLRLLVPALAMTVFLFAMNFLRPGGRGAVRARGRPCRRTSRPSGGAGHRRGRRSRP